jgi:2-amino-4-hydroxy-6-hydroxymethyldihydropteridine diphosphokinase
MSVVYLILGTNLGDRIKNLRKATELINKSIGKIIVLSSVYETEPWGFNHKSNFLNQVLKINTSLRPEEILEEIINMKPV